jgi:hypothetical protein
VITRRPLRVAAGAIAAALLLAAASASGCTRHVRARPEMSEGPGYRSVSVLPPMVTISKSKMTGGESMTSESLMMEDRILVLLGAELARKGYETKDTLALASLDRDPELKEAVADLQNRHDELMPVISRDLKGVEKGRFSLGGDVPAVGGAAGTDLLAFVRAQGVVVSGGQKAFYGILSLGQSIPQNSLAIRITVVDARDGRVMATVSGFATGRFVKSPDEVVGRALAKALRKFPPAKDVARAEPAKSAGR